MPVDGDKPRNTRFQHWASPESVTVSHTSESLAYLRYNNAGNEDGSWVEQLETEQHRCWTAGASPKVYLWTWTEPRLRRIERDVLQSDIVSELPLIETRVDWQGIWF